MSYQVLARKWRPQVFEDVVGQGHITRTLQNAITTDRLAHAFLFSGPRGVGKTTTARILAKALNCKEGPTPSPCGKCSSCLETAAGTSVDVIEIDGASNRGIEHIRELRETVKYSPVGGKYKVYVIDEVHMLTNEAFNALLKTLEEPPPHVIFIFATTEPQKIPATIHSRCQRYGFKRISSQETIDKLREIAGKEGITISDQGLGMVARAAEGSMRDSQSLLDQAVSFSGMNIRDEDLQIILGSVAQEVLRQFTESLLAKDAGALLLQVDALLERGQDMRQFLAGVIEHIRNLIIIGIVRDPGQIIELSISDLDAARQQAAKADKDLLLMQFDALSRTLDELRWSPHQRFTLELGLVRACSLAPLKPLAEVLAQVRSLEARLGQGGSTPLRQGTMSERPATYTPTRTHAQAPAARTAGAAGAGDDWSRVISAVKSKKPTLGTILSNHSRLLEMNGDELVIGISGAPFQREQIEKNEENRSFIEKTAGDVLNRKCTLKFQPVSDDVKKPTVNSAPRKQISAEQPSIVQDALKIFGGEVIETEDSES